MEKDEILEFVKNLKVKDHVIFFYANPKDKHDILFTYLKAGLEDCEAVAYVASQESPEQIKRAMRDFGIDVEQYKRNDALRIINYKEFYIIDGKFDIKKTIILWEKLFNESMLKGFKGFRVAGEMACFFENGMVKELIEYERALHKNFEIEMIGICAYDSNLITAQKDGVELLLNLLNTHSKVVCDNSYSLSFHFSPYSTRQIERFIAWERI